MSKKVEDQERIRKHYIYGGGIKQKRYTFLIDEENFPILEAQATKSRFINNLLKQARGA